MNPRPKPNSTDEFAEIDDESRQQPADGDATEVDPAHARTS
jgi:hypothetical protein